MVLVFSYRKGTRIKLIIVLLNIKILAVQPKFFDFSPISMKISTLRPLAENLSAKKF